MSKDGRDLQKLIAAIERAKGHGHVDLKVESPAYRLDKVTGKQREHDVLLTYTPGHHQVVMALECRNRSRPIGTDAVEAFHTKCENTGIHHGMMVSAKGFTKPALAKATFYNIRCLNLDAIGRVNWCLAPGMHVRARHITHTHVYFAFPDGIDKSGKVVTNDGKSFGPDEMKSWAGNILGNHSDQVPFTDGDHRQVFSMPNPPFFIEHAGNLVQAVSVTFTINYTVKTDLVPFAFRKYSDAVTSDGISEAAVATIPVGGERTADFILSTGEKGVVISVVPNKK